MSRHLKWVGLAFVFAAVVMPARTQASERPAAIPNKADPNGPFGTEWAKPGGTQGSYIYNDPRLRDPSRSRASQRGKKCPAPKLYDPASGACR